MMYRYQLLTTAEAPAPSAARHVDIGHEVRDTRDVPIATWTFLFESTTIMTVPGSESTADWRKRIRVAADGQTGRPTIRGLPISVAESLQSLAAGVSAKELLHRHPDLQADDIAACLAYGAEVSNGVAQPPGATVSFAGTPETPTDTAGE